MFGPAHALRSSYLFLSSVDSIFPTTSSGHAAVIHSVSAASAGAIATLATHPFDVIKVCSSMFDFPFGLGRLIIFCRRPKYKYALKTDITDSGAQYAQFGR